MTTTERALYKVIGTRPIRPDGVEKVTGRAQYGADVRPANLIHARILEPLCACSHHLHRHQ
jgi:CO/xanthine dehydrogenase Mo-binding subunit